MNTLSLAVAPNPAETEFPSVDTITLAGSVLPGKWTLLEAPKKYGWQIQKGFGLSGAFVFPTGDELVTPKFRGEFWASSDYGVFKVIRAQLLQQAAFQVGGTQSASRAMGIDHPELKALGVNSVVVAEITPLVQEEGGLWACTVSFIQYRAPIPAPSRPKGEIPDVAQPTPTAQDAQDVEIQKLQAEAEALLGK